MDFDVFISHANSDKAEYVNELKASIEKLGVKIFYDKDSIEWGDNWKERLLHGIHSSEFAIIVISESFFGREWTEKELNEFLNRQNSSGQKIILPILHNITFAKLQEKYPNLASLQAIESCKCSADDIAILFSRQLIKRLKFQIQPLNSGKQSDAHIEDEYIILLKRVYNTIKNYRILSRRSGDSENITTDIIENLATLVQQIFDYYEYNSMASDANDTRLWFAKSISDQYNSFIEALRLYISVNHDDSISTNLDNASSRVDYEFRKFTEIVIKAMHFEKILLYDDNDIV